MRNGCCEETVYDKHNGLFAKVSRKKRSTLGQRGTIHVRIMGLMEKWKSKENEWRSRTKPYVNRTYCTISRFFKSNTNLTLNIFYIHVFVKFFFNVFYTCVLLFKVKKNIKSIVRSCITKRSFVRLTLLRMTRRKTSLYTSFAETIGVRYDQQNYRLPYLVSIIELPLMYKVRLITFRSRYKNKSLKL